MTIAIYCSRWCNWTTIQNLQTHEMIKTFNKFNNTIGLKSYHKLQGVIYFRFVCQTHKVRIVACQRVEQLLNKCRTYWNEKYRRIDLWSCVEIINNSFIRWLLFLRVVQHIRVVKLSMCAVDLLRSNKILTEKNVKNERSFSTM